MFSNLAWFCSLFDFLDLAPVEFFLEHDSRCIDISHQAEYATADPEEDDRDHNSNEGVRVDSLKEHLVISV